MLQPEFPIVTERLLLRPFTDDDLDSVFEIERREDVARYLYNDPLTRDEVRESLGRRKLMTGFDAGRDALRLAVVLPSSGVLVGDVSIRLAEREHRQGEIGFSFHPDHHGHGYGTEAATVMLRLGFEEASLHRIFGRCDARNVASARLMERLGMRREAHLRENEFVKGEWCDELIYAMLASEWAERDAADHPSTSR